MTGAKGPARPVVQWFKRLMQSDAAQAAACWVGALYIRLVRATGGWTIVGEEIPESFRRDGKPFILAFWHGRLMMMPYCWRRTDLVKMLISSHRDGRLISSTVGHFGIESVVGSSSKGGAQAMRNLLRLLRDGGIVGITPDGPRGPRMRVGEGTIAIARLSGAPIVPATFAASRRRVLGSWDRFVLALPFTRGTFLWGEPIHVPRDADAAISERCRLALERAMNELTARADAMYGQAPIEAARAPSAGKSKGVGTPSGKRKNAG